MDKLRLLYSKTGRAVYISHLDLMRTMRRSFLRAGLRLRHSEGFNPHPMISVALPLPVGAASRCEMLEFVPEGEGDLGALAGTLDRAFPEGLEVISVYPAQRRHKEIKRLLCEGNLEYNGKSREELEAISEQLEEFFAGEQIAVIKKTKSGEVELDIAPLLQSLKAEPAPGAVCVKAVVSAQEPTLNPDYLISALRRHRPGLEPDFHSFVRLEVYDAEMRVFR